jgi:hypothetical protein
MRRNQSGFSPLYIILIIIVVFALGLAGYMVWNKNNDKKDNTANDTPTAINSFADCKAAGNPIQESFPEKCSANGKMFTNEEGFVQESDLELIDKAIISYCTANGATDPTIIQSKLTENAKDPNLYAVSAGSARVSASCGEEGGFRAFLQKTKDNAWKLIAQTQMETAGCAAMDGYTWAPTVATQCYDENGELRDIK